MKKLTSIFYLFILIVISMSSCHSNKQKTNGEKHNTNKISVNSIDSLSPCWSRLADLPTPRNSHMVAIVNNKIYVAGGITSGVAFEAYDLSANSWESKADMPHAREFLAGCTINGKIYAIGGWSTNKTFDIVEEYDPTTDSWERKSPMPTQRWGHAAIPVNGKIYVIGGALDWPVIKYYNTIEIYDPAADSWTTLTEQGGTGLTARWGFGACMANNKIYVMGGVKAEDYMPSGQSVPAMGIVEEYDPALNTWAKKRSMPSVRWGLVSVTVNNKIYAIGGGNIWEATQFIKVVEEYDPVTDTWVRKSPMPIGLVVPAVCVLDNIIYIPGGGGFKAVDAYVCFYSYDPAYDSVSQQF
jgi:N-acetylneuraminic acid mutarotase